MRLWSIHPSYLDAKGLVALWREGLLAQAVIYGKTKGYKHHPQLDRFREAVSSRAAIATYLRHVHEESVNRGYRFAAERIIEAGPANSITVTTGQLEFEWQHLLRKLESRDPVRYREIRGLKSPDPHPLFQAIPGAVEPWERV